MTHSYSNLLFHMVWSTKNREPLIIPAIKNRVYGYMNAVIKEHSGFVFAINGMPDHLHMLISLKPTIGLPDLIKKLKTGSTKWLHREIPSCRQFAWQEGYGVFTVGYSNQNAVIKYIQTQEEHHQNMSYEDEFIGFLDAQGISYDRRFVLG